MIKFTDAETAKPKQVAPKPSAEAVGKGAPTPPEAAAGDVRKSSAPKRKKGDAA